MRETKRVILGSRGSGLAMAQAEEVRSELKQLYPKFQFEIKKIKTIADIHKDIAYKEFSVGDIFTKQIDEALLRGEIDLAVHSMKDVPCDLPEGIKIVAVTKRRNPTDVLVNREGLKLKQLPWKAKVGTSSLRRKAQLLSRRPDLEVCEIRGNLDTRLKKLRAGEFDTIIVAQVGLERLNYSDLAVEPLGWDVMLPAVGQGCLAIEARREDKEMFEIASRLNHNNSSVAVQAERSFLKVLGGGCRVPIACLGRVEDGKLWLEGRVFSANGNKIVSGQISGLKQKATELGRQLAVRLLSQGAREILAEALR